MGQMENQKLFNILLDAAKNVSMGKYEQTDSLMELTNQEKYPPMVSALAEAFGMMIIKVESREFNLEQLLSQLKAKNKTLEETLARVQLLESIRGHLNKFVPKSVQTLIEHNPENPDFNKHERHISVLFLDIAGYTKMSETTPREKMNHLIETYFSDFLNIIVENHGDINETAGDGLMILFLDDNPAEHARNAVSAAVAIQKRTALINASKRKGQDPVVVNMGINSGTAAVGSTRFSGIAGDRWTYTASGSVTNIAARICGIANKGSILVTEETAALLDQRFTMGAPSPQTLKNVSAKVLVRQIQID
jgi:class 3 adenylate cyclase